MMKDFKLTGDEWMDVPGKMGWRKGTMYVCGMITNTRT